jgi:hypothetical protein
MPPPTATDEADNAPASAAPTCSVEALIVVPLAPEVPDNSLAVTVLDLPVMATEAPIAAIPPLPPPADTLWVERADDDAGAARACHRAAQFRGDGVGDVTHRHRRIGAEVQRKATGNGLAVDGLAGVRTGRGVLHRGHDADGRCHDDGIQVGKNAAADIGVTDAGADADVLAEAGTEQEHLRRVGAGCADINLRGRDMTAGDLRRDAVIAAGQHRADVIRRTGTRIARVAGLPATDHTCAVVGIGPLIDRPQRAVELTRFLTLGVRIRRIVADDDHADGRPDADRRTNPRRHRVGQNFLRARRFDVNDAGRIHVAVAGFRGGLALEHEHVGGSANADTTGCDRERAGDFLDGDVLGRIHRDRAGRTTGRGSHRRIVDSGNRGVVGDLDVSHAGSGETSSRERSADRIGLEPVDSRCLDVERPGQADGRGICGTIALVVEFVADIGLGAVGADLHQEGGTDRGRAAIGARAIGGSDAGAVLGDDRQRRAGQRAAIHVSLGRGDEDVQPDRRATEANRDRRRVLLGIGLDRNCADGR